MLLGPKSESVDAGICGWSIEALLQHAGQLHVGFAQGNALGHPQVDPLESILVECIVA